MVGKRPSAALAQLPGGAGLRLRELDVEDDCGTSETSFEYFPSAGLLVRLGFEEVGSCSLLASAGAPLPSTAGTCCCF